MLEILNKSIEMHPFLRFRKVHKQDYSSIELVLWMPRVKNYPLIMDVNEIFAITKKWSSNPRPRCGKCKQPTYIVSADTGKGSKPRNVTVGRCCLACNLFWPMKKRSVLSFDTEN